MNTFINLFAIFVVLLQIQITMSQSSIDQSPQELNQIQRLCKSNRYQTLCISTLNHDPRSKTSNFQGLASIAFDATTKKVNETLQYLISVLKKISSDRAAFERYGTCVDQDYGAAVHRYLPAVSADLKAKKYYQAISNMKKVLLVPGDCEQQFAGKSPETARNKAVHDIVDMTIDMFKTFLYAN